MLKVPEGVAVFALILTSALTSALVLQTVVPGWGFKPHVNPVGHFPVVFSMGLVGALVVAARTTCRWGVAWAVMVGAVLAAIPPVQYLAGIELEPDQRVAIFFGPPMLFLAAVLGGYFGAKLGARLGAQRNQPRSRY